MKHVLDKPALGASLALAAAMAALVPAQAATTLDGSKGSDATECAALVREYKAGTPKVTMVRGSMSGITHAANQASPETFDLVPWHELDTVVSFIAGHCANKPKTSVAQAVSGLASALGHKHLKTFSAPVKLRSNGASPALFARVFTRMARALAAKVR